MVIADQLAIRGPGGKTEVSMCKKGAGKPHTRTYVGTWKW